MNSQTTLIKRKRVAIRAVLKNNNCNTTQLSLVINRSHHDSRIKILNYENLIKLLR